MWKIILLFFCIEIIQAKYLKCIYVLYHNSRLTFWTRTMNTLLRTFNVIIYIVPYDINDKDCIFNSRSISAYRAKDEYHISTHGSVSRKSHYR